MFEHFVLFHARSGRETDLDRTLDEFGEGLSGSLPALLELTWGRNVNPSGLDRGFTHACLARLGDEAAFKDAYWVHPAHVRLLEQLDDLCESRFAVDYTVSRVVTGEGGDHDG